MAYSLSQNRIVKKILESRFLILFVSAILIVDQGSKYLVVTRLPFEDGYPIIENIFHLNYVENTGAAFGILPNHVHFFITVSLVAIVLLAIYYRQLSEHDFWLKSAVCLIMGGALGNLIDRLRLSLVIDFLDFIIWPVFNFADVAISIGVGMLIIHMFGMEEKKAKG